jgi:hypothetical protein
MTDVEKLEKLHAEALSALKKRDNEAAGALLKQSKGHLPFTRKYVRIIMDNITRISRRVL